MVPSWLTATVCLAAAAAPLAGRQQTTASVYGVILDQESGKPVPEVRISLSPDSLSATTGGSGYFALTRIPFGRYTIRFERLGYVTRTDTLQVGEGAPLDITVRLATSPIALDPIVVTVRSGVLESEGFYERRALAGGGTMFITAEDIEKLNPALLTDVMTRVPAVKVFDTGPGKKIIRFNRQDGLNASSTAYIPGCEPAVFLDGYRIQDQIIDNPREPRLKDFNRVDPFSVAGIEVYVGANTPLRYKHTSCGAVLIWTKRGG